MSFFKLVNITFISFGQSSEITCLHAPHGETGRSVSATTASAAYSLSPSE